MDLPADTRARPEIEYPSSEAHIAYNRQDVYKEWRAVNPIVWTQGRQHIGAWLVLSHDVARAVMRDDHKFSKEIFRAAERFPDKLPPQTIEWMKLLRSDMFFRDDPDHKRLRGLVVPSMDRRTIESLPPKVNALCDTLLPELEARGEFDAVCDFAWPVASLALTEVMGIEPKDAWRWPAWALDRRHFSPLMSSPDMLVHITTSVKETDSFLARMLRWRAKDPKDDMISKMAKMVADGYPANEEEMISSLRIMGLASFETVRDLMSSSVLALCEAPGEVKRIVEHGGLPEHGLDELLRFVTPDQVLHRGAKMPLELGGQQIAPGEQVLTVIGAANRDPEVFEDPDTLRLDRANADQHLAFSGGSHFCAGSLVARALVNDAIGRLFTAMPTLKADKANATYTASFQANSLRCLPVTVG